MKYVYTAVLLILCFASLNLKAQSLTVYVDPSTGSDANSGSIEHPYLTIPMAMGAIGSSGGTIYLRGGVYSLRSVIKTNNSGKDSASYNKIWAYPGEKPVLDFSLEPYGSSSRGLYISKNYWYIKGLEIKNAGDNGVYISGSHNIVENCSIHDNQDSGMQLSGGASYNKIINCDSYFNCDPGQGNADGFAPKLDVGEGNYFYGCRSWQNSDDGWDGYMRGANDVTTTLENCWCFMNGYLKDGSKSSGNGNGFKMGGSDDKTLMHDFILKNCISFDNLVKGFDQNNNKGSMTLINCSGYRNGTNYSISLALNTGKTLTIKNCISYNGASANSIGSFAIEATNSWQLQGSLTDADFLSPDTAGVRGPRKADGSLPDITFLHIKPTSPLVDAGTDVGLPFNGNAPDLGAFESGTTISRVDNYSSKPSKFYLEQNYPNPFNPATVINFSVPGSSNVKLTVYNSLGQEIAVLLSSYLKKGAYTAKFNGSGLSSGIYFYRLEANGRITTKKMILLK